MAETEENQHNTLAKQEENQDNTLAQLEENQHNTLDQLEEIQHTTLAQQENNQSFADFLEQFMSRPLAEFLDEFLRIISFVIELCFIYDVLILQRIYGIDTGNRTIIMGVFALWMHGILCYAILGWFMLNMISKCF